MGGDGGAAAVFQLPGGGGAGGLCRVCATSVSGVEPLISGLRFSSQPVAEVGCPGSTSRMLQGWRLRSLCVTWLVSMANRPGGWGVGGDAGSRWGCELLAGTREGEKGTWGRRS